MEPHGDTPQTNDGLLTKSEAAELLKVSGRTVDNWCYKGLLPYSKIGQSRNAVVRIRRADVETMLSTHRIGGAA
jgi:excisionase family DNA binding protein